MANVLIIDDEASLVKLYRIALTRAGFHVETAVSASEGFRKLRSDHFDIILTDIEMPDISGNEIAAYARVHLPEASTVIGMSGTPWAFETPLYSKMLVKPFSIKQLLATVNSINPSGG